MSTAHDLRFRAGRMRNSRLAQARQETREILRILIAMEGVPGSHYLAAPSEWQSLRDSTEHLVQCVHEANATNNLLTEAEP